MTKFDVEAIAIKWKWTQASLGIALLAFTVFVAVPRSDPTERHRTNSELRASPLLVESPWSELCEPAYFQRMNPEYPVRRPVRVEALSQTAERDAYYDDERIVFMGLCRDPAQRAVTAAGAVAVAAVLSVAILEKTKHWNANASPTPKQEHRTF